MFKFSNTISRFRKFFSTPIKIFRGHHRHQTLTLHMHDASPSTRWHPKHYVAEG